MVVPISERARHALDLRHFNQDNDVDYLGQFALNCPFKRQYALRMIVRHAYSGYKIPPELRWTTPLIAAAHKHQEKIGVRHLCCYVTVRHGIVTSQADDEWHTDGFSTKITHLPEQNYLISSCYPTEYVRQAIEFPKDFNPLVHNVHKYIQHVAKNPRKLLRNSLYCLDPYNIHRRPPNIPNVIRTMVRVSHTPIEIMDDENTPNPLLPMPYYNRDGVSIRNKLLDYGI